MHGCARARFLAEALTQAHHQGHLRMRAWMDVQHISTLPVCDTQTQVLCGDVGLQGFDVMYLCLM